MKPKKKITVEMANGEDREFDAHDFMLLPTGHASIVYDDGVMKLDGTPSMRVLAMFAPGGWICVRIGDVIREAVTV